MVRLRPRPGGDVFDLALAGKTAIIESIEQDYEGKPHLAVVLDDDPGRDLGLLRQPGHRFFFGPGEVELSPEVGHEDPDRRHRQHLSRRRRVRRGGGDRLSRRTLPAEVRVVDFGIRGFDLAYALLDGYDVTILVDATTRGEPPGTLYTIEIDPRRPRRHRRAERRRGHSRDESHARAADGAVHGWLQRADPAGGLRAGNARV